MKKVWPDDFIGNTPYINIDGVYLKMEGYNPSGSIKDRVAQSMIYDAENSGILKPGMKIFEATSGNLGISLAMFSAIKGYDFTAIMPENAGKERIDMIHAYGGQVILTSSSEGSRGSKRILDAMKREMKDGAWFPDQLYNKSSINAHRYGTGIEIAEDIPDIDVFVAAVGTGGTLIGTALAFEDMGVDAKIVAVEPKESSVLSGNPPGPHGIKGIGRGEITHIVSKHRYLLDEVMAVSTEEAIQAMIYLWKTHGVSCGISGGANFIVAKRFSRRGAKVVTVLPDRGDRYLSQISSTSVHQPSRPSSA